MEHQKGTEPSHVVYRHMAHAHPLAVRGEGVYLWDTDGKRYIDGSGGAAVANIGHGVAEVAQAMAEQAANVAYVHGTMFTTDALETHSERLAALVPMPGPRFYYMTSGSEAVETAIKFARQVQIARGEPTREVIISRWASYHGATLGTLAVTGRSRMRIPFAPLFRDQPHIVPPYCYRCPFGATYPACDLACARALEAEILRQGPERVAAFIAESVSGATLGAVVPPQGYWPLVRQICDRYGVLLIADEVMAGLGRTGRWFAIEHFGVQPDMITMGKGVTGGYFPLSVTAVRGTDVERIRQVHGDFVHGGTFSHHAVGAAVGLAVLRYVQENDLVTASAVKGKMLGEKLVAALGGLSCVGDVRGIGLLWGVEFVADRVTKVPFPPAARFARRVADTAFDNGLIVYAGTGCADGMNGDLVLIAPPFIISEAEMDEVARLLREAILEVSRTEDLIKMA
jgi:adenosylmethionine-8-amino-7-oxononanoate aminotransferase